MFERLAISLKLVRNFWDICFQILEAESSLLKDPQVEATHF